MWGPPVDEARGGNPQAIWFEQAGGEPSLVRAAAPLQIEDAKLGALVVEQAGEQLALVRELALTRLLNLTMLATLFSMAVTLVFAARLSHRMRRLARAAATALTPEGRIEVQLPGVRDRDELGTLARSYDTLLSRVKDHTTYLQTLGSKLSHELRTPLTIVSSSLENLGAAEDLSHEAQSYLQRARDGAARAHGMLTAMSEATRVEQSIEHTERVKFDVTALVRDMGLAYQQTFARHTVETIAPEHAFTILGSPELIAQMLDKLLDNAADFAPDGARVVIALDTDARSCRLSVATKVRSCRRSWTAACSNRS
jgi:signal transduction histidine kinase